MKTTEEIKKARSYLSEQQMILIKKDFERAIAALEFNQLSLVNLDSYLKFKDFLDSNGCTLHINVVLFIGELEQKGFLVKPIVYLGHSRWEYSISLK